MNNTNATNKKLQSFFFISLAAALISAVARIAVTILYFDADYGVYASGSILPTVTHILTLILCLLTGVIGILAAREYPCPAAPPITNATVFTCCITAFLIAASTILSLYNVVVIGTADKFTMLKIATSIPAVVFFLSLIKTNIKPTPILAIMSFFPTAWFAVNLIEVYFDNTLLITSPVKDFHQLALLSIMLFLLCESRFILGNPLGKLFFTICSIAPILVFTSSIPAMLIPGKLLFGDTDNFLTYAVEFAASLFILSRSFAFIKAPRTLPKPKEEENRNSSNS